MKDYTLLSKLRCSSISMKGFRPSDCFPFVFQNLIETTGISAAERTELRDEMMEWTPKIM